MSDSIEFKVGNLDDFPEDISYYTPGKWAKLYEVLSSMSIGDKRKFTFSGVDELRSAQSCVHNAEGKFRTRKISDNELAVMRIEDTKNESEGESEGDQTRNAKWSELHDLIKDLPYSDTYEVFTFDDPSEADNARRSLSDLNQRLKRKRSPYLFKVHRDKKLLHIRKIRA